MDNRTDAEKEASPYFARWEYTGPLGKLGIGPRKAVFKTMSEAEAIALADAGETVNVPVMVSREGERKAITFQEFNRLYDAGIGVRSAFKLVKHSPWALRCIDIRAKSLASIPWALWQGESELPKDNDWVRLLREVNPEVNWMDLMSATEADMNVFGLAFWLKGSGAPPRFIQRLNPAVIDIIATGDGIQGFRHTKSGRVYSRANILFFHNYDPEDDFGGASPLESVRAPIEVEIAANAHLKEFFENKAMPDYIMSLPTNNTNEIKRLADQWKREFQGKGNQHKTGWVGGGAEPHMVGYAPRDLAVAEVREEARRQICAGFGVPPALVAAWEAANYATIREQRQSLYTEVLFPEARYFAGVINAELMPPELEFRWDFTKVDAMQDTEDAKTKRMVWLVDARIIKAEVAAEELGYDPDDVPEELPMPSFGDSSDNNNNVGRATAPPGAQSDNKTEAALRKWRRKVLNRLRDGKPALCDFESDYITDTLGSSIKAQLEDIETADGAHEVFEAAIVWREYP